MDFSSLKQDFSPVSNHKNFSVPENNATMLTYTILSGKPKRQIQRYLLRVHSPFRSRWETLIMLMAIWNCFYVPFQVAFMPENENVLMVAIDIVIDFAYFLDVVLYARTTYIDSVSGEEITDSRLILKKYCYSGKLAVDVLSAVPFDILSLTSSNHSELQFITLFKVVRLLRINKIISFMQKNSKVKLRLKLLQLFLIFLTYLHLVSCLWFLVTDSSDRLSDIGETEESLLSSSSPKSLKYGFSLYVTLAAADIGPKTEWERVFMGSILLLRQMFQAYMFAEIFIALFNLNRKSRVITSIQNAAATTMIHMKLDGILRTKISAFLESGQGSMTKQTEVEELIRCLPPSLKQEIYTEMFESITRLNPVLSRQEQASITILRRVRNLYCQPELKIVTQGEAVDGIYFISSGKCSVWVLDEFKTSHKVKMLTPGSHFGEIALLFPTSRTATVISANFANMAILSKEEFANVCRKFPEVHQSLKESAVRYTDCWKLFVLKTLKMCPFFHGLSAKVLSELAYRLPLSRIEANNYIYKEGEIADKITFIIAGSVEIYSLINDSRLQIFSTEFNFKEEQTQVSNKFKCRRDTLLCVKQKRDMRYLVKMAIDEVGMGSVLCANLTILGERLTMFAKTTEPSVVLTLTADLLQTLAAELHPLGKAVAQHRESLLFDHKFAKVRRIQMTNLDYEKNFPADTPRNELRLWAAKMKVRRCAIGKMLEQREIREKGFPSLFTLSQKLKGILEAEKTGDAEMAEKIRRGAVSSTMKTIFQAMKLLHMSEVENPVLTQFAAEAVKVSEFVERLMVETVRIIEKVSQLDSERKSFRKCLSRVQHLVDIYMALRQCCQQSL